jgi:hypothetical protein
MSHLSPALSQAFGVAAAELGFCTSAWLFVRELATAGGSDLVRELRDSLGRTYPVLDAVAAAWLDGCRAPVINAQAVVAALAGARTVLIVGIEADFLDALVPLLAGRRVVLLSHSNLGEQAWQRVLSNYASRLESVDLMSFQRLAGSRCSILCMVYGATDHAVHVPPAWLRLFGDDVRAQFRAFVGWDVLPHTMYVYPRWLVEVPRSDFSVLV